MLVEVLSIDWALPLLVRLDRLLLLLMRLWDQDVSQMVDSKTTIENSVLTLSREGR